MLFEEFSCHKKNQYQELKFEDVFVTKTQEYVSLIPPVPRRDVNEGENVDSVVEKEPEEQDITIVGVNNEEQQDDRSRGKEESG